MRNQNHSKTRSDRPSGRQASEQPEHIGKSKIAPESLHQGQGPEFQTQDRSLQEKNLGVKQLEKLGSKQTGKTHEPLENEGKVNQGKRKETPNGKNDED